MENQITRERGQLHPLNYLTFSSFSILPLRLKSTNLSALVIAKEKIFTAAKGLLNLLIWY